MSEYIYLLQATEEQYLKMMKFLDVVIKKDGLEVIQDVVDIYNVLVSGQKMQLPEALESTAQPEVPTAETVTPPETVG